MLGDTPEISLVMEQAGPLLPLVRHLPNREIMLQNHTYLSIRRLTGLDRRLGRL